MIESLSKTRIFKLRTIHTSRTLMFSELARIMDHSIHNDGYQESLKDNVINKTTGSNLRKTSQYLKNLYIFNRANAF